MTPPTDYAARITAGLVGCNAHAAFSDANCPRCAALDALASLEAELAEARRQGVAAHKALDRWQVRHAEENVRRKRAEAALREAQHWHEQQDYDEALNVLDRALDALAASKAETERGTSEPDGRTP